MAFGEKSAWAVLAAVIIVYGWYATVVVGWGSGPTPVDDVVYQPLLITVTVPLVILLALFHAAIAIARPKEAGQHDERDRIFEMRAEAWGGLALGIGVFAVLCLAMISASSFWVAHAALGALVLAELAKQSGRIMLYRKAR